MCASAQSDTNKINTRVHKLHFNQFHSLLLSTTWTVFILFLLNPRPRVVFHIHTSHSFTFKNTLIRYPGYFAASNLLFAVHPPIWVTTRVFGIVVFVVRTSKDFNANTPSTSFNQHGQLLCSSINLCKITVF